MRAILAICVAIVIGQLSFADAEDAFDRASSVADQASDLQTAGKADEAKRLLTALHSEYDAAVKRTPQDPLLLAGLAGLQAQLHAPATALKTVEAAMLLKPGDARFHNLRGFIHMQAGDTPAAEPEFRQAVELAPKNVKFRSNYAALLANLDRMPEAEAQARAALDLDARNPDTIFLWSTLRYNNGKVDDALGSLRAGVELHPRHYMLRKMLGAVLFDEKQYDEAYVHLFEAHRLNREEGQIVVRLVYLASQIKKPQEFEGYVTQLYRLHRKGKFEDESFIREKFTVGDKKVGVKEFFAPTDESPPKYIFYLYDERGRPEGTLMLITTRKLNQFFRKDAGDQTEPMSALVRVADGKQEHYGGFATQPGYDQTRKLVVEILEGKRQPFSETPPK